jgi:hypothetical protein
MKCGLQSAANEPQVYQFTCLDRDKNQNEVPHVDKAASLLSVFTLRFATVIDLLVTQNHRYYHQYLDRRDKTPNPLPEIMNSEMFLFLAIILHVGHDIGDRFRDYWTQPRQFFTPFCCNTETVS